jgi:hypothetical protein
LIRHSQSYLFGAISGTAVIAAAVVFFILFVSAQALRDWPISDLHIGGGGNDSAAVAPAESLGGSSTNAAAEALNGPVIAQPAKVGSGAKAGGGNGGTPSHRHHRATGKVSPETQIQGGRGVDSAPVNQPSSTSPAPAPTTGSSPPAGSGTASPSPSGGNGSAPTGGNSGSGNGNSGNAGSPPANSGNVGTRTTRQVTKTVKEISTTATPPAPTPVTHAVQEVEERVAPTPPPAGSTSEKVAEAIGKIGK